MWCSVSTLTTTRHTRRTYQSNIHFGGIKMKSINVNGATINLSDKEYMSYLKQINSKSKVESKKKTKPSNELHIEEERTKTTWEQEVMRGISGHEDRVLQISDVCTVYHTPNTDRYMLYITIPTWLKWTVRKGERAGEKFSPFEACKKSARKYKAQWVGDYKKGRYMWQFPNEECARAFVENGFHC